MIGCIRPCREFGLSLVIIKALHVAMNETSHGVFVIIVHSN